MNSETLYERVKRAQLGDQEAMNEIITAFLPLIRRTCRSVPPQEREDWEQGLILRLMKAVRTYDLSTVPDFRDFCQEIE
ncbi:MULTISPECIES: helix-turn-helix domain-containing protein [Paenibacillus]|uniref:helix-turn-helix domain-containing protein n=1 Tax=Paenibacillus TaxID=44249 RepID=UPI0022B8C860|nr:helix-turn-helix domain-containing protein [Paenibacillus caseinilyticus]MCZ8519753.1 helix-turn-helix domain-containing protein [Paenibacillus caseinilyticus]